MGQQRGAGKAFAQRMNRALGSNDLLTASTSIILPLTEYRLLLPVLQYVELCWNVLQLLFDLAEEGAAGTRTLFRIEQ